MMHLSGLRKRLIKAKEELLKKKEAALQEGPPSFFAAKGNIIPAQQDRSGSQ